MYLLPPAFLFIFRHGLSELCYTYLMLCSSMGAKSPVSMNGNSVTCLLINDERRQIHRLTLTDSHREALIASAKTVS